MTYEELIEHEYTNAINTPSDINEHLQLLRSLAEECVHVTEMGVYTGNSTRAFLSANVTLRSYDLDINDHVMCFFDAGKSANKDVEYIAADTRKIEIDDTDLLFLDTHHSYTQVKTELLMHGNKARKYIVFHDTTTFGLEDQWHWGDHDDDPSLPKGILPAIVEFMISNPHWRFKIFRTNNNGLTVLERISNEISR